jgi:hypothetical protein
MRVCIFIAALIATALLSAAGTAPALAAAPDHELFTFSSDYVDTELCGFPIAVHADFKNMIIDASLLTGDGTLQLHQYDIETWTAKGVTLRALDHYTIFVEYVGGVPQTAKHVGSDDTPVPAATTSSSGQASCIRSLRPERRLLRRRAAVVRPGVRTTSTQPGSRCLR